MTLPFDRPPAGADAAAEADPLATARRILATIMYMTLATADEQGLPWASPVWFAPATPTDVYSHRSQELGARPWSLEDVTPPGRFRLFRAVATATYVLGPGDRRIPVDFAEGAGLG